MPRYTPAAGHSSLTGDAATLTVEGLGQQADIAEVVLGIHDGRTYTGDDAARLTTAVARQISYQVEAGVDGQVYNSWSRGGRSVTYRGGGAGEGKGLPAADPIALRMVRSVVGDGRWGTLRSLRG